jgi:hypothetical protein
MIGAITLKFTECLPITIPAEGVTVFVGPNNAGKSLVLRELDNSVRSPEPLRTLVLDSFDLVWLPEHELASEIERWKARAPKDLPISQIRPTGFALNGEAIHALVDIQALKNVYANRDLHWVSSQFAQFYQLRLDGRTRFGLTNDRQMGDLTLEPQNIFARLFKDDELRKELREIVHDALKVYFVIDPTAGSGNLRIRLSSEPPNHDEQSLNEAARQYHSNALHIKEASDGVQAFIGILIAARSSEYRTVLIDEPEAFLHPPLARKVGFELTRNISKRRGALLASTHSADFLMGCLQASPNVRVVRLEYSNGKSKGKAVDSTVLQKFLGQPLIRSANVISGLFHDGVVVTESDNDRAFYAEVYHRISSVDKGCPSLLFVNAQNKQTIRDIIGPLRQFGVPAAAIPDIDILKDGGQTWTGWLASAGIPTPSRDGLAVTRNNLKKAYVDAGIDMKADGGVSGLPTPELRATADSLFDTLDQYGVFVVRRGELESWLPTLNVPGKKTDWTVAMLERMGSDPADSNYVHPAQDDVWAFMRSIVAWIKDPARRGS